MFGCDKEITEKDLKTLIEASIFAVYLSHRAAASTREQPRPVEKLPFNPIPPPAQLYQMSQPTQPVATRYSQYQKKQRSK